MLTRLAKYLGFERRLSPRHPDAWLFGEHSTRTPAGVYVGVSESLTFPAFYAAVNLLASDVARTPLNLYRRLPDGGREIAEDHPAHQLLRRQSNELQTAYQFKLTAQSQVCMYGNSYSLIVRGNDGRPAELETLQPGSTQLNEERDAYRHTNADGSQSFLALSEVLHIRGINLDGGDGLETWSLAKDSTGLGLAAASWAAYFFGNGARPAVVLEHPNKMDPTAKQNLRAQWQAMHGGLRNSHSTAVLENGMQARVLSFNSQDAELTDTRRMSNKDAANFHGVPPHKVGDEANRSYASLEQENMSYVVESLDRHFCNWESELDMSLLLPDERDEYFFEFNRNALMRADIQTRFAAYSQAIQSAWMTPNEVRALENMPAIDGGDKLVNAQGVDFSEGNDNAQDGTPIPDDAADD
jgi:HK97 family phage portal protein